MKTSPANTKKTELKKPAGRKQEPKNNFRVVAIGASAGGLESMVELLKYLPANTGMSFIYVQHLSPDHKSLLTEILSKKTKMKVQEIDDMDKIQPDNVFVIPYNKGIEVNDGHIKLIPRSANSSAISIDILFSSIAKAQKNRVVGIILSGTANDGTQGIKNIKQEGGITFAQDDSAKYKSMPHSAIASGTVDFILSPKEIASELVRLSKHAPSKNDQINFGEEDLLDNNDPYLKNILAQLLLSIGVDFRLYKMNTIKRRIIRRMLIYKIKTLKEYSKLLSKKKEEIHLLYQDLLINVTSFFRDTDSYKYLKDILLPKILKRKKENDCLRIWVAACATGEEAYSIAMLLLEIQASETIKIPVQIFATDLSNHAIEKARTGIYSKQEIENVSPARLQLFFSKTDGNYRVDKSVRDMCVFATHNVLSDPPFSKLDFISCCNLFIYFDNAAQKKVVDTFHYALNREGFLMLGKSENLSHSLHHFTETNKKYKIFSRNNTGINKIPELLPQRTQHKVDKNIPVNNLTAKKKKKISGSGFNAIDGAIDAVLMSEFMPASVVINYQMDIVQFRGTTELYLTHPKGKATFHILKMARPEIAYELRNAIATVIKTKSRFKKSGIEVKLNAAVKIISLEIIPLQIESDEPLLLVVFTEQDVTEIFQEQFSGGKDNSIAQDRRIKKLEQDLNDARTVALSIAQEQEAFTEELQSANEEVVSSIEELQIVNEELETSKEEIVSANEELTTTNQELQTRNELLNESYEYSEAIVNTMHEPMLVLGNDLRVKSANRSFYKKFGVNNKQTEGVLLYDLGNKQWDIPVLRKLLEEIIPKNAHFDNYEVKHTFLHLGEKIMSLNASRIIQKAHREHLILLIISDITEIRTLLIEKESREKEFLLKEMRERKAEKIRLEKAVQERTRELKKANELLALKNFSLEKMNTELEAFSYVASHDLQEPLRKIQTFASIINAKETQNLSANGIKYFQLMQTAAGRMQQLIRDLLVFSKISADERKFEAVDMGLIIDEIKQEFEESIAEKHAVIEVNEICKVRSIHFQFRQLMHNLISNALKFSNPDVPPHIVITSKNHKAGKLNKINLQPDKEYCHINITDNGIGFKKQFSKKIFEVFQRLHEREKYSGTGIGLAIVKKIVDNHNGIIMATSEVNKGTSFDIYIPSMQIKKASKTGNVTNT